MPLKNIAGNKRYPEPYIGPKSYDSFIFAPKRTLPLKISFLGMHSIGQSDWTMRGDSK